MEERIKRILSNEYYFNVDKLTSFDGGFYPDEIYLLVTLDQVKYLVKYIQYSHSLQYLQSILRFENILHDLYEYPCPQIILSKNEQIVICDEKRFLFVQTFIQGIEPTREIIDKDDHYLNHMGCLLAQWRLSYRHYSSNIHMKQEYEEFTDQWWNKQQINNLDSFLLSNFVECKQDLINLSDNFERGLIHNDFHTNNSIMTNDRKIFIIDFVDACQSVFVADLATSLFHLLIHQDNGKHRAKAFLHGYQQILPLTLDEINTLDKFVRLKLTLSIIEDSQNSNDLNHVFIQSCLQLLQQLKSDQTFVKNLLE
jgi:Ser/Thr protein kinase RdoA (MazF antagonist)